jgi:hypothetical protein
MKAQIINPRRFGVTFENVAAIHIANESVTQEITIAFELSENGLMRAKVFAEEVNKLISQMQFRIPLNR